MKLSILYRLREWVLVGSIARLYKSSINESVISQEMSSGARRYFSRRERLCANGVKARSDANIYFIEPTPRERFRFTILKMIYLR